MSIIKRTSALLLVLITLSNESLCQRYIAKFFPAAAVPTGGAANVDVLLNGFLAPLATDLASTANNAWYSTPVVHKRWGFDVSVSLTTISAPENTLSFASPVLSGLSYTGTGKLPTAYGEKGKYPSFSYTSGANAGASFRVSDGAGLKDENPIGSIVIPTAQFGIGVFKDTDFRLRFSPKIEVFTATFSNWGVGVMHDFKRYIPAFITGDASLSAFAGFSQLNTTANLTGVYSGDGQEAVSDTKAFTFQVTAGKEFLKFLTLFAGVGINTGSTQYKINGRFVVDKTDNGEVLAAPVTLVNPFDNQFSKTGFRSTVGMRLRGGPIFLNSDLTFFAGQRLLSAGFGVTVR